jgi:hypothetical protein
MEFLHLSSVKYSVGGLNFMDGRGFVGISVFKRGRKWSMKGIMEKLQTMSFACRRHVRGLEGGGFDLFCFAPNFKNIKYDTEEVPVLSWQKSTLFTVVKSIFESTDVTSHLSYVQCRNIW